VVEVQILLEQEVQEEHHVVQVTHLLQIHLKVIQVVIVEVVELEVQVVIDLVLHKVVKVDQGYQI
tara:strand:+ start:332 stop:526 length:195 start_codon:yes stop_codon:yes gene_type:complete